MRILIKAGAGLSQISPNVLQIRRECVFQASESGLKTGTHAELLKPLNSEYSFRQAILIVLFLSRMTFDQFDNSLQRARRLTA